MFLYQRICKHIAKATQAKRCKPKLCQRACKANAPREIVLKNLPTLKKK